MKFETRKCVEVSTGHVTHVDTIILTAMAHDDRAEFRVAEYEYGYYINLLTADAFEDVCKHFSPRVGWLSAACIKLIKLAIADGAQILNLDKDGPCYDELEKFHW